MTKAYLTILFITLTMYIVLVPVNENAEYGQYEVVSGTYEIFTSGLNDIEDRITNTMETATNFVNAVLYIPRVVNDTFTNAEGLGEVCTTFEAQTPIQKGYLQTARVLYNLLNEPNIETIQAYWIYEQERVYGLVCS